MSDFAGIEDRVDRKGSVRRNRVVVKVKRVRGSVLVKFRRVRIRF